MKGTDEPVDSLPPNSMLLAGLRGLPKFLRCPSHRVHAYVAALWLQSLTGKTTRTLRCAGASRPQQQHAQVGPAKAWEGPRCQVPGALAQGVKMWKAALLSCRSHFIVKVHAGSWRILAASAGAEQFMACAPWNDDVDRDCASKHKVSQGAHEELRATMEMIVHVDDHKHLDLMAEKARALRETSWVGAAGESGESATTTTSTSRCLPSTSTSLCLPSI
jgi:hypothetical protein